MLASCVHALCGRQYANPLDHAIRKFLKIVDINFGGAVERELRADGRCDFRISKQMTVVVFRSMDRHRDVCIRIC